MAILWGSNVACLGMFSTWFWNTFSELKPRLRPNYKQILTNVQNIHPVPPKIRKISVSCMKFQGASIGKGPWGPKEVKNPFFYFGPRGPGSEDPTSGPTRELKRPDSQVPPTRRHWEASPRGQGGISCRSHKADKRGAAHHTLDLRQAPTAIPSDIIVEANQTNRCLILKIV